MERKASNEIPVLERIFPVINLDGSTVKVSGQEVKDRFLRQCHGMDVENFDLDSLTESVVRGTYNEMTNDDLNDLMAQAAAYSVVRHPDYGLLGGRLAVEALHKKTSDSVLETYRRLYENVHLQTGRRCPLIKERLWKIVEANHEWLQSIIDYERDFTFEFFGFKTLERSYLLRTECERGKMKIIERPQHLWLRVALGIHFEDLEKVRETYDYMSKGYFTHATPTLFNAGTPQAQMSSCFLIAMKDDSIEGIYDTLKECAIISKCAGGIGFWCHNIRSTGSYIAGTNGTSNGLLPMLRVWNNTARYVDQGGGKRKGAFAAYIEPWHADIFDVIQLRRNTGADEIRARDLFYGLWIPDLFMERVQRGKQWCLFDPHTAPGLDDVYGDEFVKLYEKYEREKRYVRRIQAQELWFAIMEVQMETGIPYLLFKDACNKKSNQKNIGTIKCSNLCTEIVEYTNADETAVCNLCSVALPRFIVDDTKEDVKSEVKEDGEMQPTVANKTTELVNGSVAKLDHDSTTTINGYAKGSQVVKQEKKKLRFDFKKLYEIVKLLTVNLNRVIDNNFYPVPEAERSNKRHRPIGFGVQGLADTFIRLGYPFTSPEAKELNEDIFETIYFGACEASMELALREGKYETFDGSPASQGILQFDLWNAKPRSGRWDWDGLKQKIIKNGMRNSLLVAPMPTASTSQILGNTECFEPITSNIYIRRVLSGEFPVVNKYLVLDLIKEGLWTEGLRQQIISMNGSIQGIPVIPDRLKQLYRTVWEIRMKDIIDMAADRAKYIDQSMSMNVFLPSPTTSQLTSMHFYTWKKGLKTGSYYLRSCPAVEAIKFTVDVETVRATEKEQAELLKKKQNGTKPEECLNCGS